MLLIAGRFTYFLLNTFFEIRYDILPLLLSLNWLQHSTAKPTQVAKVKPLLKAALLQTTLVKETGEILFNNSYTQLIHIKSLL